MEYNSLRTLIYILLILRLGWRNILSPQSPITQTFPVPEDSPSMGPVLKMLLTFLFILFPYNLEIIILTL